MSIFTHEKLKIEGLPMLKSLLDLKIEVKADEHGVLLLEGYAEENGSIESAENAVVGGTIEVWPLDDNFNKEKDPIFCGIVTDYEIDTDNGTNKLKIKALTGSYLLDLDKKSRSFQDVSMTYEDVVRKVLGDSNAGGKFSVGKDTRIGKPLIQYHETNWEFIKRLASHFNSPVIPDTKSIKPNIWFGINERGDNRALSDDQYTVGVSENYYKACAKQYNAPNAGFIYYDVKEKNNCFIGDKVNFRSSNLVVCKKTAELIDAEIVFTYTLGVKTLLSKNIEYNAKITGMSLIGTVKKTAGETVNIQLDIDGANGGYEYPYNWAPTSGNTMYCMPKVGTKVTLLLPNDDERDATATNAPRENGGSKGTCAAMADPNQRAFVSEHSKKMNLFPSILQFAGIGTGETEASEGIPLHAKIEDDVEIIVQSNKMLLMVAKEKIDFEADKITFTSLGELGLYKSSFAKEYEIAIQPIGTGGSKANPSTGGDSSFIIDYSFDFKGVNNVLKGYDYRNHPQFNDAPEVGEFNLGKSLFKAIVCVAAVAVVAVVIVGTGGGAALAIIGSATIAAGCQVVSDGISGNVSGWGEYALNTAIGAVTGAFGHAVSFLEWGGKPLINGFLTHALSGATEGFIEVGANWLLAPILGVERMSSEQALLVVGANTFFEAIPEVLPMGKSGKVAKNVMGEVVEEASEKAYKEVAEEIAEKTTKEFTENAPEKMLSDVHEKICKGVGDPVSPLTGTVFYDDVDFEYQGIVPIKWVRSYRSNNAELGAFGYGTSFSYGMYIKEEDGNVLYVDDDARKTKFRTLECNQEVVNRTKKIKLSYDGEKYTIFNLTSRQYTIFEKADNSSIYKLVRIENETREHTIEFNYDSMGNLSKIIDTVGKEYLITTNNTGQITKVKANGETLIEYKYDENLNFIGLKDISGGETFVEYDGHLMTKKTSKEGDSFYWEYSGTGDKAKCIHTYGDNGVYEYWLKFNDGNTESTDSLGHTTTLYYDENFIPYKEEDANGGVKLVKYNEFSELVKEVSEDGEVTKYTYNDLGLISEVVTATGGVSAFEYTEDGRISKATNPLGSSQKWVYDENGRVVEEVALNGAKTYYEYDENGLVNKIIEGEEDQRIISLEYDDKNNVVKAVFPNGAEEKWEYDQYGNCISNTTPLGATTKVEYDKCSRIRKIHSPDGKVTELDYNYYNKVTRLKNNEKEIKLKYNSLANLVERKEQDKTISFKYDTEGNLIKVINEVGEEYEYIRDHRGDILEEKGYDGVWKKYRRTLGGKVRGTKRSNESEWVKINYDKTGLMSSILYPDGKEELFKFGVVGELLEAENEVSKVVLTYDEVGKIISENQNGYQVTSEYSKKYAVSQREVLKSSLGLDLNLTHNEIGAVEEVVANFGNIGKWQNKFEYNKVGQMSSRQLSEDLTETRSYDIMGRITNQGVTQKSVEKTDRKYTWDINNKIKSIVDGVTNIGLEYSYDKYGNLEGENCSGVKLPPRESLIQRSFDKSGNVYGMRSKMDREYKKGGQLVKIGRATYLYNDAGDLIEKKDSQGKVWKYEYYSNGLLSKVIRPDKNEVTFEYDALKRRISKTYKGKTTKFLWDGNKVLHEWKEYASEETQELDVLQTPQSIVTWLYKEGTFVPIGKLTENDSYSIVSDHLGTPTEMYNSTGTLVWKVVKDIYGRTRHKVGGENRETDCPIRFQGQYEDYETEMYYNRFRYYMPDEGMYSQRDPIGLAGGNPTLYGFVWDSTKQVDVFGLNNCAAQGFGVEGSASAWGEFDEPVELGKKMDYLFGKATGRPHNIERSKQMFDELKKIGIYDTPENRNMIELNLAKTYNNPNSVSKVELIEKELKDGSLLKYTSTTRESFIMGPYGGVKMQSFWDGNKLNTIVLKGGNK